MGSQDPSYFKTRKMEFDRSEFWDRMLGPLSATDYAVFGIFFLAGAGLFFYTDVKHSLKTDVSMPNNFNFWFMVKDNLFRLVIVLVTIFLAIRFHKTMLGIDSLNEINCLYHGIAFDALFGKIAGHGFKKVPVIKKMREAEITRIKNGG